MTKQSRYYLGALLIIICISWGSCKQINDPCLLPTTVALRFGSYKPSDTGTGGSVYTLKTPILGTVDTPVAYYWGENNKFSISLDPLKDSCRWFIMPDSAAKVRDTLTFRYSKSVHFLSNACGYIYYYTLSSVIATNHLIDSVIISNYEVTGNAKIEHVKIFY